MTTTARGPVGPVYQMVVWDVVTEIAENDTVRFRMGVVRVGATVRIQSRTSGGGAILAIGDDRVAVSRRLLRGVVVHAQQGVPADV